jgi:hypothetical protein
MARSEVIAVFHATTHSGANALQKPTVPMHRIGSRAFVALVGLELLLLLGVLVWALTVLLPPATPLVAGAQLALVEDAIRAHVGGAVHDPLVSVGSGHSARASNVRGFSLSGETYYYYVEGTQNFDPLSRGAVRRADVEILFRDSSGPMPFVVYRIL